MSTELILWEDPEKLKEIRRLFAPALSDLEFQIFLGLGKATGLNPFTKEIWAVKGAKDKSGKEYPAQIFVGRDGYRKAAQAHSDYDFHLADAVYENDDFEVSNGQVNHKYKLTNRGRLIGAYCIAKRHKSSMPHYVFVELEEYTTGQSLWAEPTWKDNSYGGKYKVGGKPATMIKKVAESQCLRACFQDLLGGTYGEEEFSSYRDEERTMRVIDGDTNTEKLKNLLGIGENNEKEFNDPSIDNIDNEPVCTESDYLQASSGAIKTTPDSMDGETNIRERSAGKPISGEQLEKIETLFNVKDFSEERIKKALKHYQVKNINELDSIKAENLISYLERA